MIYDCLCQRRGLKLRLFTISKQSIHHAHHSQFFGRRRFYAFHCQVKEERKAFGKGFSQFFRHEHVPFVLLFITVGGNEIVFLEHVTDLSLFADNVCAVVSFHEFIDYLQLCLIETAEDLDGIVNYFHCYSACCLVFLEVRAGIKVTVNRGQAPFTG